MNDQATNTVNNQTYAAYCSFRLPCGICTRTNSYCPIAGNTFSSPYTYKYDPTCTASDPANIKLTST